MDRQHRRELKRDRFIDEMGTLSSRARENQRLLFTIAAAVAAAAILAYGLYIYRSNREQKAQQLLASAIDTLESPLIPPTGQAPPNAKFKTDAERVAKAEPILRDVESKYSGSDAASLANLYLARILTSKGDIAGARKRLESFVADHPKTLLGYSARYSLYQMRIESGEAANVVTELNVEMAKSETSLPQDSILSLLAHAYDTQGNHDKSLEVYRRIAREFSDSPYALEAQRRIGGTA
ncbi:MAG TPA: tetratricopeptide repeat protein [Thermoanaerobaculia bacterium]|nr:tetratricopeptide repeat protein [Thermoanaerobaculia bacterium]